MAALDVIRVDLELRFRVDLGVVAEQQVVVALPCVDALPAALDDDVAVDASAASLADDAAKVFAAQCRARGMAEHRVVVDVLVLTGEQQAKKVGTRACAKKCDGDVVADEASAEIEIPRSK